MTDSAKPAPPIDEVTRTAPERIWLQISDDADHCAEPFPTGPKAEVTWCEDSVLACQVAYVRADLYDARPASAAPPEPSNKAWMMPDGSMVPAPNDAITGHRMPEPSVDALIARKPQAMAAMYRLELTDVSLWTEEAAAMLRSQQEQIAAQRKAGELLYDRAEKAEAALKAAVEVVAVRGNLLMRIRAWDMMDRASDGAYWRKEIDAAIKGAG